MPDTSPSASSRSCPLVLDIGTALLQNDADGLHVLQVRQPRSGLSANAEKPGDSRLPVAALSAASSVAGGDPSSPMPLTTRPRRNRARACSQRIAANNQFLGQVGSDVNPTIGFGNQAGSELAGDCWERRRKSRRLRQCLQELSPARPITNSNLARVSKANHISTLRTSIPGRPARRSTTTRKAWREMRSKGYEGLLQNQQGLGLQGSGIYANSGLGVAGLNQQANNLAAGATGTAQPWLGRTPGRMPSMGWELLWAVRASEAAAMRVQQPLRGRG